MNTNEGDWFRWIISLGISILNYLGIKINLADRLYWKQVINAIQKLDPEVRKYNPDILIGVADGMVVTGIIATNFSTLRDGSPCFSPYLTLGVNVKYGNVSKVRSIDLVGTEYIPDLTDKKVLIIDDHIYTGVTLKKAVEFIKTKNPKEIKSLVLFASEDQEKECYPDYVACKIKGRLKVPWSYSKNHESVYKT